MAERKSAVVSLFTRFPNPPGSCKTRLIPTLGPRGASRCQTVMTERVLDTLLRLGGDITVEVRYATSSNHSASDDDDVKASMDFWLSPRLRRSSRLKCREQPEGDLGHKMAATVADAFEEGHNACIIVGADVPGIGVGHVRFALEALKGRDMVLGPAEDGGYYLVGVAKGQYMSEDRLSRLFCPVATPAIEWGTSAVLQQQVASASAALLDCFVMDSTLSDVDTPEDLPEFEAATGCSRQELVSPTVSVVIPTLNEEKRIASAIRRALDAAVGCTMGKLVQVIVSDGGSTDGTMRILEGLEEEWEEEVELVIVKGAKGRGAQQNLGAEHASGSILAFLHADTWLPDRYIDGIVETVWTPGVGCGAFSFGLDCNHDTSPEFELQPRDKYGRFFLWTMRLIEGWVHTRCKNFELPFGDQVLFLRRSVFTSLGGFRADHPIMEDIDLVKRVKTSGSGHVSVVAEAGAGSCGPAVTSCRRWHGNYFGLIGVTGFNQVALIAYHWFHVEPATIHRWYYNLSNIARL